jgi:hypothetical protein
LRDYAFPKIGRMPIDAIDQPEVMMCFAPIWTEKHETAKRLAQRIKTLLDVARSKGFRSGENPVTAIKDAQALPRVKAKVKHQKAMGWKDVPAFYADLKTCPAMAAKWLKQMGSSAVRAADLGFLWPDWRGRSTGEELERFLSARIFHTLPNFFERPSCVIAQELPPWSHDLLDGSYLRNV